MNVLEKKKAKVLRAFITLDVVVILKKDSGMGVLITRSW